MSEKLLHGPDVRPRLQQVGGETVPQGVWSGRLGDAGALRGLLDGALQQALVDMMPANDA